jgi:TolA-binding protein
MKRMSDMKQPGMPFLSVFRFFIRFMLSGRIGLCLFLAILPARAQNAPAGTNTVTPVDLGPSTVPATPAAPPPVALPADPNAPPPLATPVDLGPTTNAEAAPATPGAMTNSIVVVNPAEARFNSAMDLLQASQFADAVGAFSDFIRDFPQDRRTEEALYRLGESYRALGRVDDALAAYTFEVKNYPEGPLRVSAQLRRGAIYFDQNNFADAIPPLQEVVAKGDGDIQAAASYLLGRAYLATQKETEGRGLLQPMADAQPPGKYAGEAARALAELDDSENKPADALPLWQKALTFATDPATQAAIAARGGWSAMAAGDDAAAEKLFQQARQADPSGAARKVANTGLLRILFKQKRYPEWQAIYNTEQNNLLDSAREEVLYDLGHAAFATKRWSEAATGFDQYLREFPTQPGAVQAAYERFIAITQVDRAKTVAEAESYLKTYPQSPYRARVQLVEAQELSAEKKFTQALPLWESLATQKSDDADWPRQTILLELARSYDELKDWPKAATAYQSYLDDLAAHPGGKNTSHQSLQAQARLAVALQNSDQLLAATQAWQAVQAQAPAGSPEQEMALEALGLIYARGGPGQQMDMAETFRKLLQQFPQSPLRAMAAFSVGDAMFQQHDYAGAENYLREAREWDAKTWHQPATQRLALAAYGMKSDAKTRAYVKEYDAIPLPADPQARIAARLPAALFYWLAEQAQQAGRLEEAENFYTRVTQHPDPGDLLAGAWWQLGEVQSKRKEWTAAVASYSKYRELKPDAKDATAVLLALGRVQLGAGNFDAAKALGNQALLQEPEGPNSAAARMLLAEAAFASQGYAEAARMFATLAVLFDDPKITPQAMARAADAFDRAGDAKSAADWRAKLQAKYPNFQPAPYL